MHGSILIGMERLLRMTRSTTAEVFTALHNADSTQNAVEDGFFSMKFTSSLVEFV